MRCSYLVVLALVVCAPAALDAQSPSPAPPASALAALRPGARVRLTTTSGERLSGRLRTVDLTTGLLSLEEATAPIALPQIDSLWTRGTSWKQGALIGGGAALVGGGLFWGTVCDVVSEGQGCDAWDKVVLFSAGTGVVGALVGGAVGAVLPRWTRAYARAPVHVRLQPGPAETLQFGVALRW